MAQKIKATNYASQAKDLIRMKPKKYRSIWNAISPMLNDTKESIYMIMFDDNEEVIAIEDVSDKATSTESSVAMDQAKVVKIFETILYAGMTKWGLSHNHPYMEVDGEWAETLVSGEDVVTTELVKYVAAQVSSKLEYVGHYIANKEDTFDKIICMDEEFKFNLETITKIEEGA